MSYRSKIRNTILYRAIGRGMILGGIISIIVYIGEAYLRIPGTGFISSLFSTVITCAVVTGISVLCSTGKMRAVRRRTESLQNISSSLDYDNMESLGRDIAMGDRWLVLRDKSRYSFWIKDRLEILRLEEPKNPAAKQVILELQERNGILEKYVVTRSDRLAEKINDWMCVPEPEADASELTLGQM